MPQMSPFNWTFMFTLFLLMTITLMSKMFFNKKNSTPHCYTKNNNQTLISQTWTW